MHPAEHGSYVTLPVRLSQWDFNYGPAIDGSTQMSDFQKDDRRQMFTEMPLDDHYMIERGECICYLRKLQYTSIRAF